MAEGELGASFAIHGGGSDLVFPHHENEIAQSEAAGRPFARVWMHNGMVETDAAKMSKSEGNIFQLSEALDRYGREAVVAYLISGHYRQPLAFGPEQMEQAVAQVERMQELLPGASGGGGSPGRPRRSNSGEALSGPPPTLRREALARSRRRWPTTSILRGLWPRCSSWSEKRIGSEVPGARRGGCAEMLELVGLGSLTQPDEGVEADDGRRGCCSSGRRRGRRRTSGGPTRFVTGSPSWAGRYATRPTAPVSCRRAERWPRQHRSTGSGRSPRPNGGGGGVHRVWRAPETSAEELERLCGSPDHQGVVAEVDPYPYGDPGALLRGEALLISPSTRFRTRATSAPSAARPRRPAPPAWSFPSGARPRSPPSPARPRRARSSTSQIAHVRNLADWLAEAKEAGFWIWGADAEAPGALGGRPRGPDRARPRGRGQGHPAPGRGGLRRPGRAAAGGLGRLPQRLRRGRRAALRGRPAAQLRPIRSNNCNGGCRNLSSGLTELRAPVN